MAKTDSSAVDVARRAGHRLRLRNRYLRAGLIGLEEYEMVELLLTYAIPRRDVKPYAKMLLERFGSMVRLLDAEPEELMEAAGMGEGSAILISLVRELCSYYLEQKLRLSDPINSPEDAVNFFRMKLGGNKRESLLILLLDSRHRPLAYEICTGTIDRALVFPPERQRTGAEESRGGSDPRPQPPQRRVRSLQRGSRHDPADPGDAGDH